MSHPDTNEILHESHGWDGRGFYDDTETVRYNKTVRYNIPTEIKEAISLSKTENDYLKSENAYLRGKITVYEKFLKDKGFIKEGE